MNNPFDIAAIRLFMDEKAQLASRRAAGGARGRNGVDFEDDYAASRLVELAASELEAKGSGASTYVHGGIVTFVDDLYVFNGNKHIFSQAKRGVVSEKTYRDSIIPAFEDQLHLAAEIQEECERRGSSKPEIEIELVVSTAEQGKIAESRLKDIAAEVKVYDPIDLRAGPATATALHDMVLKLCSKHRGETNSQLLFEQLSNAWYVLRRKATIRDFVMHAAERSDGFLQTLGPDYALPADVEAKLAVDGFDWKIVGSNCYYRIAGAEYYSAPRALCGSPEWKVFERRLRDDESPLSLMDKFSRL